MVVECYGISLTIQHTAAKRGCWKRAFTRPRTDALMCWHRYTVNEDQWLCLEAHKKFQSEHYRFYLINDG
jgi:hypothetical protein